jgi:hypothetical protein
MCGDPIPSLPASRFLAHLDEANGSKARDEYEGIYYPRRARLEQLVIAECMENDGRFLTPILDYVWILLEESSWSLPTHIVRQRVGATLPDVGEPIVDLFSAETANLLAWTRYLVGSRLDGLSPVIVPRIDGEIRRRILDPCLKRDDFHWMGFKPKSPRHRPNNWNPWVCSNWLSCILLSEADRDRRVEGVHRVTRVLDNFLEPYPDDGGCDEGPQYWDKAAGSCFDSLCRLEEATGGAATIFRNQKVARMGRYIAGVHICGDYYYNHADADAAIQPDGPLVYAYGERIDDSALRDHGAWLIGNSLAETGYAGNTYRAQNLQRMLRGLMILSRAGDFDAQPSRFADTWFAVTEIMTARDHAGSDAGLFVAAKGGHNHESHNHNDIGSFIVYTDGRPLIVDAGVERYTARTFGPNRYDLWTMQSAFHSLLPRIDGVDQQEGFDYRSRDVAFTADEHAASLSLDLAGAYPDRAGVEVWRRRIELYRGAAVEVTDDYRVRPGVGTIDLAFLTPCAVNLGVPGEIRLDPRPLGDAENDEAAARRSGSGALEYDGAFFQARVEEISTDDERLGPAWGDRLYRVVLSAENPPSESALRFRITGAPVAR